MTPGTGSYWKTGANPDSCNSWSTPNSGYKEVDLLKGINPLARRLNVPFQVFSGEGHPDSVDRISDLS